MVDDLRLQTLRESRELFTQARTRIAKFENERMRALLDMLFVELDEEIRSARDDERGRPD